MKVLKLYGHKNNTGGIVNLQNSLEPLTKQSKLRYMHYRTGRVQNNRLMRFAPIRIIDQLCSYLWYPVYLLINKPNVIEINSSLVPYAFKRDYIYAKLSKTVLPKTKLVLFNHGWNYEFKSRLLLSQKKKWLSFYKCFDEILILASIFKKEIKEELELTDVNLNVITTGVNVSDYSEHIITKGKKQKLNILFLSRLEKTKGVDELLNAIPKVLEFYPNVNFSIAGTGSFFEELTKHEIYLKYKNKIMLHGYVRGQEKLNIFKNSDVFVFPSYYGEGCPVSVLEALAVGLPLVYTEVGALPDILQPEINGILIEKKSSEAVANALKRLIGDYKLRQTMSVNNLQLSHKFDLAIIQQKLEDVYTSNG